MSIEEALKLLKEYGCIKLKIAQSSEEEEALRQAILLVNQGSESINLGICADNNEAVYIKYNTQRQASYLDSYTGTYRGVLVSCQSENDQLVGTYGHFPLDLFSEEA